MASRAIHWFPMNAKRHIAQMFLAIAVATFVFGGFLTSSHFGIDMQREGSTGRCPFMPGVVICNMTPLEHISAAQSMFNILPQDKEFFALLMLLLATAIAVSLLGQRKLLFPPAIRRIGFVPRHEDVLLFRPLQEAFSNGVIHSKAF